MTDKGLERICNKIKLKHRGETISKILNCIAGVMAIIFGIALLYIAETGGQLDTDKGQIAVGLLVSMPWMTGIWCIFWKEAD